MRRLRTPPRLVPRASNAHKASVGKVLVVGGCRDMCGAPALTALGALRAGAGLVRIAVPREIQGVVAAIRPEATTGGLPQTRAGSLAPSAAEPIRTLATAWDAVVLGPGGGRAPATLKLMADVARTVAKPLVLDADGLFALASKPEVLRNRRASTVITPHEGEAGRLLGIPSSEIRADREAAALALAARSGAVVVLKGPGTLVTDGERLFCCRTGGPWLASGGTGDVLAGIVGAFLAGLPGTGGDALGAASAAVHVHGAAADAIAKERDRGILASDVATALPNAVAALVAHPASRTPERRKR